ncbi:MAG: ATP-binding domain-containing protein, partial [Clostridium sp.]
DFRKIGSEITLERPLENSPNPINDCYSGDCFNFKKYSNEYDMVKDLANNIKNDIDRQKLSPSRDILVVNLKEGYIGNSFNGVIGRALNDKSLNYYIPGCGHLNTLKESDYRNNRPDNFWADGAITIASIIRAKGNEAAMVYVVGVEDVAVNESSIASRNKLFTALTRAKCWVTLMGVGSYSLYSEIEKAIESNGKFTFTYRKPKNDSNDAELE